MYDDKDQDYCVSYRFQHCEIKKKQQQQKPDQIIGLFIHPPVYKETERSCLWNIYIYFFLQILNVSMSFGTTEVNMIV